MAINYLLEIFLGMLGFGLCIMFCTTFCRLCSHFRAEQLENEARRRNEQEGRPPPIYFIRFPGGMSQQDSEDHSQSRHSQEFQSPPRYSVAAYCGPPPSYNELGFKPDDLPPAYTEYNTPVYPISPPPPHTDVVQPQTQSQQ